MSRHLHLYLPEHPHNIHKDTKYVPLRRAISPSVHYLTPFWAICGMKE
jgi:hypothetical protein